MAIEQMLVDMNKIKGLAYGVDIPGCTNLSNAPIRDELL